MLGKSALLLFLLVCFLERYECQSCKPKTFGINKIVCVCNSDYCDYIEYPKNLSVDDYASYTSSEAGQRFEPEFGKFMMPTKPPLGTIAIKLNIKKTYQSVIGFGGAGSDSTVINIQSLPSKAIENLYDSYFSENGLEYNILRIPIGGTDFSTHGYSYDDGESDPQLKNFKLAKEDYTYKIPFIKKSLKLNPQIQLFASAWTAPIWMKHNRRYTGPDHLRTDMYQSWANYFVKFLEAYKTENISFWGITTGNEPTMGLKHMKLNSVGFLPRELAKFVVENLGPTLRNSQFSSIKLMALDDNIDIFPFYIPGMYLTNPTVGKYLDGFAVHWYNNKMYPHSLLTVAHLLYPDKFILSTEASTGVGPKTQHVILGDWGRAEDYAYDIIVDFQNWVTGWVDWNMALDMQGGPTYIKNYLDSPIIVNANENEFYKQPMFYAIGHFSKFVVRNSTRVSVLQSHPGLDVVGFVRPDGGRVLVILNKKIVPQMVAVIDEDLKEMYKAIPPKSITTIAFY